VCGETRQTRSLCLSRAPASSPLSHAPPLYPQVAAGDLPHTLFYGPAGAGKTTLMKATLRELYGPGVERVKVETTPWKVATPSRTVDVELTTLASNYHVELTPADAGNMDRCVERERRREGAGRERRHDPPILAA
jgi:hypothetical protein